MSMKRSKQRTSGSRREDSSEEPEWMRASKKEAPVKTWAEYVEGQPDDAFTPYALKTKFTEGQLVSHPKFGKGAVVLVIDKRIEVLFSDGKKSLGHAG
jgi:hypothetical protein